MWKVITVRPSVYDSACNLVTCDCICGTELAAFSPQFALLILMLIAVHHLLYRFKAGFGCKILGILTYIMLFCKATRSPVLRCLGMRMWLIPLILWILFTKLFLNISVYKQYCHFYYKKSFVILY